MIAARETVHQRQRRKPTDIYTIHSFENAEDPIRRTATNEQEGLLSEHQHKKPPSLDSSVIPFAEISPVESANNDKKQPKQRFKDVHENSEETLKDGRRTRDFQRRPRHKMRSSSQNLAAEPPEKEKRRALVQKKRKGSKSSHSN